MASEPRSDDGDANEAGELDGESHGDPLDDPSSSEVQRAPRRRGGFTSETAKIAGRRGGHVVSRDREHMSRIGRRGVEKRRLGTTPKSDAPAAESGPISASRSDEEREPPSEGD
jgi:hypothetical protein